MQIFLYPHDLQSLLKDLTDFKIELDKKESMILEELKKKLSESVLQKPFSPAYYEEINSEVWQCGKNINLVLGVVRSDPDLPKSVTYLSALLIAVEVGLLYMAKNGNDFRSLFGFESETAETDYNQILNVLEKDAPLIQIMIKLCTQCIELLSKGHVSEEMLSSYGLANIHFDSVTVPIQSAALESLDAKKIKGTNYYKSMPNFFENSIAEECRPLLLNSPSKDTNEVIMVTYDRKALFTKRYPNVGEVSPRAM